MAESDLSGQVALVIFASRDWKVLARESTLSQGRDWLTCFGFSGPDIKSSVAKGLEVGFEVTRDRQTILDTSRLLLDQVNAYVANPTGGVVSSFAGRGSKPRKKPPLAWPKVLPPLIDFLADLHEPTVKIFNHHL